MFDTICRMSCGECRFGIGFFFIRINKDSKLFSFHLKVANRVELGKMFQFHDQMIELAKCFERAKKREGGITATRILIFIVKWQKVPKKILNSHTTTNGTPAISLLRQAISGWFWFDSRYRKKVRPKRHTNYAHAAGVHAMTVCSCEMAKSYTTTSGRRDRQTERAKKKLTWEVFDILGTCNKFKTNFAI